MRVRMRNELSCGLPTGLALLVCGCLLGKKKLNARGSSRRLEEARANSRRLEQTRGGSRRLEEARGGSRKGARNSRLSMFYVK